MKYITWDSLRFFDHHVCCLIPFLRQANPNLFRCGRWTLTHRVSYTMVCSRAVNDWEDISRRHIQSRVSLARRVLLILRRARGVNKPTTMAVCVLTACKAGYSICMMEPLKKQLHGQSAATQGGLQMDLFPTLNADRKSSGSVHTALLRFARCKRRQRHLCLTSVTPQHIN